MFLVLNSNGLNDRPELRVSMFMDRAGQFIGRHAWPLRLDSDGQEVDDYDDGATTYCVVEEGGRHRASLRLRPSVQGSMVEQHFPELWNQAQAQLTGGVEVSRFCAAPNLSPTARIAAVSDLLLGLCRHCQREEIPAFFGVVFPPVARVIRQCGWSGELLAQANDRRGALLLMEWRASGFVAWSIQEQRELRERSWRERRLSAERLVAA